MMKNTERQQAIEFIAVVKQCLETIENVLNSLKRHATVKTYSFLFSQDKPTLSLLIKVYLEHLKEYIEETLIPLLENRIETAPEPETEKMLREIRADIIREWPLFNVYIPTLWSPNSNSRTPSKDPIEVKRQRAKPLTDALESLLPLLEVTSQPITEFEYRYLPANEISRIALGVEEGVANKAPPKVVDNGKRLRSEVDAIEQKQLDPRATQELKRASNQLLASSRQLLQENADQQRVSSTLAPIRRTIDEQVSILEMDEQERRRRILREKKVFGQLPDAVQNLALIMQGKDPSRPSHRLVSKAPVKPAEANPQRFTRSDFPQQKPLAELMQTNMRVSEDNNNNRGSNQSPSTANRATQTNQSSRVINQSVRSTTALEPRASIQPRVSNQNSRSTQTSGDDFRLSTIDKRESNQPRMSNQPPQNSRTTTQSTSARPNSQSSNFEVRDSDRFALKGDERFSERPLLDEDEIILEDSEFSFADTIPIDENDLLGLSFCPNCGEACSSDEKFCASCGSRTSTIN